MFRVLEVPWSRVPEPQIEHFQNNNQMAKNVKKKFLCYLAMYIVVLTPFINSRVDSGTHDRH